MSSIFLLFRLPQIAYFHVIKLMGIREKVIFSLCSRDTYILVRHPRNKLSQLKLWLPSRSQIDVGDDNSIAYHLNEPVIRAMCLEDQPTNTSLINIEGNRGVPVSYNAKYETLYTFWEDVLHGELIIREFMKNLFQSNLYAVLVEYWHAYSFESFLKTQTFFERVDIADSAGSRILSDEWEEVMWKIECNVLYINAADWNQKFQLINYRKSFEFLFIRQASWVTLDNLKEIDMVNCVIQGRMISNIELNMFLKNWIRGGSARLKFISIDVKNYNEGVALEGIPVVRGNEQERLYTTSYRDNRKFKGMEVLNVNGVKASIEYYPYMTSISLGVWPDALGNR